MSSWLSSNLTGSLSSISNLTGQISSFTREILTEGADEVSGKISWMSSFRVRFACFTVNYSRFKGQAFNFVVLSYISADCQICVNNVRCNKIISCTCALICKGHMIMTMKLKYVPYLCHNRPFCGAACCTSSDKWTWSNPANAKGRGKVCVKLNLNYVVFNISVTVTFYKLCINDIKLIGLDFEKFDIWTCVLKKFESCWFLKSWFLFASCKLLYNNIIL